MVTLSSIFVDVLPEVLAGIVREHLEIDTKALIETNKFITMCNTVMAEGVQIFIPHVAGKLTIGMVHELALVELARRVLRSEIDKGLLMKVLACDVD